jgi:hypothetical protein
MLRLNACDNPNGHFNSQREAAVTASKIPVPRTQKVRILIDKSPAMRHLFCKSFAIASTNNVTIARGVPIVGSEQCATGSPST